jgi:hypothetical protein
MQIVVTIDAPDHEAEHFDAGDFLDAALATVERVKHQLPTDDNVSLVSVTVEHTDPSPGLRRVRRNARREHLEAERAAAKVAAEQAEWDEAVRAEEAEVSAAREAAAEQERDERAAAIEAKRIEAEDAEREAARAVRAAERAAEIEQREAAKAARAAAKAAKPKTEK